MPLQLNTPLADLAADAASELQERYGVEPTVTAAAPGRVNLIGEHIDYCDGFVMPFAIDRYIVVAAAANSSREAHIVSCGEEPVTLNLDKKKEPGQPKWANYIRGVIRGFQDRGHTIPGFDATIVSSVPLGAGLSSSAALECATATLLEGLLDTVLDTKEKALLCQRAEHDFAGVPCGIMDQFASAFGQANRLVLIDCRSGEPELVPFGNPDLTVIVANTKVHHELSDGGYASRRKNTEDGLAVIGKSTWRDVTMADVEANWERLGDPVNRRSRHVVGEIARTIAAAKALEANDFEALGPLMAASHESLRNDFEVSCKELDTMVEIARAIGRAGGVIGARMTGGGFGGSTVTLCESTRVESIAETLEKEYQSATGIAPEIFASRPSLGAHLL
ncbi:galactokinase [Haloferula helveola]|uniref:Galactokinase n=1 Tax=Haloferula helveola TaxID=490095 RepID=A0ABM7RCU1_9BACT|nr:galactokinase [Haloferula helveola]